MPSLLDRVRAWKLRWRVLLAAAVLLCVGLVVLAAGLWIGWRRHRAVPLERWVPEEATLAVRVRDLPGLLHAWDRSALREIGATERAQLDGILEAAEAELPAWLGKDLRVDPGAAIPAGAPSALTPERLLEATGRDVLVVLGGGPEGRVACGATRLPFTHYAAAAVGLWVGDLFGIAGLASAGDGVLSVDAGGERVFLALTGDVLLGGTSAPWVARVAGRVSARVPTGMGRLLESAGDGTVGFALDAEAMRRGDRALWAAVRDALDAVPLRETLWTFDPESLDRLGGEIVVGTDGLSLEGTGTLVPVRIPARVRDAFHASPRVWAATDLLPETTVFASLTRNGGQGTWDSLKALASGPARPGLSAAAADVAEVVYRELARLIEIAERRGIDREVVPALGGEVAWAVFAEPGDAPDRAVPGLALMLETEEGETLLRALDRWGAELGEGEDAVSVERRRIDGTDVRVITSKYNRWSDLLTPCFASVQGKLVASSSLAFLRRVLAAAGRSSTQGAAPWRVHAREAIALRGNGAAVIDFGGLARMLAGCSDGMAELLSDRLDRARLRDRLRPAAARDTGLAGEALEQHLDGLVARQVEAEKAALRGRLHDLARALDRFVVLAGEWSAEGAELTFRAALLTPKVE